MSAVALPYSVLLLLTQFAIGGQIALIALDIRGTAPRSFMRVSAVLVAIVAALAFWTALAVTPLAGGPGFVLEPHFWGPVRLHSELFVALAALYAVALIFSGRRGALIAGVAATLAGLLLLFFLSGLVDQPQRAYLATFAGILTGALALGGVVLAMSLGHWYLVTPRLSEKPLNELTVGLLGIMLLQIVVLGLNLATGAAMQRGAAVLPPVQNPGLWLRAGVGLLFALALTFMAWRCSRGRDMMSATGLLYLASGAVLAGQALACSLIFTTGIPG